jgi:hypothetical protein
LLAVSDQYGIRLKPNCTYIYIHTYIDIHYSISSVFKQYMIYIDLHYNYHVPNDIRWLIIYPKKMNETSFTSCFGVRYDPPPPGQPPRNGMLNIRYQAYMATLSEEIEYWTTIWLFDVAMENHHF